MNLKTATILIADDDRERRELLAHNLHMDGHNVLEAPTITTAKRFLAAGPIDLAIIARDLGVNDGLELLRLMRAGDPERPELDRDLPVLITTENDSEFECLRCFEFGCDDLLRIPYRYSELRARISALLRRRRPGVLPMRLRVGPMEIDRVGRRVWVYREQVHLSRKEFTLLQIMAACPGRVFSREELMERIWGWSEKGRGHGSRTLDSHASRLRHKLAIGGADFVVNVWGVGYKLTEMFAPEAEVEVSGAPTVLELPLGRRAKAA